MYTIGHSTRTLEGFLELLKEHGIEILVDVRRWPTSKRRPHFNQEALKEGLAREGVQYVWLGESLGGYRRRGLGEESPNKAWRSRGFRNYADHALSEEFKKGLRVLLSLAETRRTAVMCAEKQYWRCHRQIISDHLVVKGHRVVHIIEKGKVRGHKLTSFAVVRDGVVTYPPMKNEKGCIWVVGTNR